ncbi:MAG: hypothetical protein EOP06_13640, partial [Proteobacteria bacterium]
MKSVSKRFLLLPFAVLIPLLYQNCTGFNAPSEGGLGVLSSTTDVGGGTTSGGSASGSDDPAVSQPLTAVIGTPLTNGKTYYLAPASLGGSDTKSGLSPSQAWLTPRHKLTCGDVIIAKASSDYDVLNFIGGQWGKVDCVGNNSVAWLKCESFAGCKIAASNQLSGILISESYWGIQGFEVSNSQGACFAASPINANVGIHHIIFANNIASGCLDGGIGTFPFAGNRGPAGVDHVSIVGNLVYNAAQGSSYCFSGISIYEPRHTDYAAGTHVYIAQNIAWANVDSPNCPGNSDGEGIILDDWQGDQSAFAQAYSGGAVVEQN